jgi:hydrogenase nickel incorporation protein HypA/HybF
MHELGIACSILETVREESSKRPESRFLKVGVRIGEVSGVEPEALIFSFDALVEGSELAPLELVIERTQRRHLCPECQHEFVVVNYEVVCPRCAEPRTRCVGGFEMEIAYIEMEDRPASAGGNEHASE